MVGAPYPVMLSARPLSLSSCTSERLPALGATVDDHRRAERGRDLAVVDRAAAAIDRNIDRRTIEGERGCLLRRGGREIEGWSRD